MSATLLVLALGLSGTVVASAAARSGSSQALAHRRTEFSFTINASLEKSAPLFGANEERKWAPGWEPQFVYPTPAKDQAGSIFRVHHGSNTSVWTTAAFDLASGHVQYVYVLNNALVTLIDIHLTPLEAQRTKADIVYERTALISDANEHVMQLAEQDKGFGKEWEEQINRYLAGNNE